MKCFAKALLDSSAAAARVGPTIGRPRALNEIGDAGTQRQFGTDDSEIDLLAFGDCQQCLGLRQVRRTHTLAS